MRREEEELVGDDVDEAAWDDDYFSDLFVA